ncbi:uncharacterized protein [Argopecten irradians]|uniref:uncharacterized protein isoform X1 n=2 Tax=Argopecten irradians TaxID=31199 RepID=UPI0037225D22
MGYIYCCINKMIRSSQRLLRVNRLCTLMYCYVSVDGPKLPIYLQRWERQSKRCKLNKKAADSIRECIEQNRRYRDSIVMESCGADEIYLHIKNHLDLAFLTQTTTKQNMYRKMNEDRNRYLKRFPLPLKELYQGAMQTEEIGNSLLVVGIVDRLSLRYLPRQVYQHTGMLGLENVEMFLLMAIDDVIRLMKKKSLQNYQVMLHTIFTIKCLIKLPATSVTPIIKSLKDYTESTLKKERIEILGESSSNNVRDSIYLVHFVVNKDFDLDKYLFEYQAFLDLLRSQDAYLIKKLESSFPGSGVPLIMAGYTMLHKVKHLTPDEFLDVFQKVRKVKTYKNLSLMKENIDLEQF